VRTILDSDVAKPSATVEDQVLRFMRLIWAVDHELERCSKRMEITHGLTVGQRMTLLLIDRYPGASAAELASLMHVHPGTMSGMLKRLEAAGFIERSSHDGDARRHVLSLTAAGTAANRQRKGTFESAARGVLRTHPPGEIHAAERVLAALAAGLGGAESTVGGRSR
jgi:MarR family transcriptional regulator, organic hydroperoxide resistance regulator